MPTPQSELFNGGVVTARQPSLLREGELQRADECIYRMNDPSIEGAPGRTAYTSAGFATKPKGIAHFTFDDKVDQIIAYVGTAIFRHDFTALTAGSAFTEVSSSGLVAGTISGTTTFTATTGFPFLGDVLGSRVYGLDGASAAVPVACVVTAVSNQDGTTGHYSTITLSVAVGNGATSLAFDYGTVASLPNVGTEVLETINIGNNYFIGTSGVPQRFSWREHRGLANPSLTMRPMGMNPVTQPFTVATTAGVWNTGPGFGAGYYWFLITEAYAPGGDMEAAEKDENLSNEIVEGIYLGTSPNDPQARAGRPISVQISTPATQGVLLTFPAVTNRGTDGRIATNWNVYMAGPTSDARTQPSLATFRRVRSVSITTYAAGATLTITEPTTIPQRKVATTNAAGKDGGGTTRGNFTNPSNAHGERNFVYASAVSGGAIPNPPCIELGGWGFDTSGAYASAVITGVQVEVWTSPFFGVGVPVSGYTHVDTAAKHSVVSDQLRSKGAGLCVQGGPQDTLGAAWVPSDLSSITVTVCKNVTTTDSTLLLDAVVLTVYFTGGTINLDGPPYRVVTYRSQIGTTVSDPSNLPPPEYTISAVFNGMVVTNDNAQPSLLRYSLPNYPEYFPKPYFMKLFTRRKDIVTFMRVVGQVLVVGLRDNIRRVNYLPTETDTDFGISGVAQEPLCEDHGIPGPQAGQLFDLPSGGSVLFYVSTAGPRLTDGITDRAANTDLDWRDTVNLDYLSRAQVRVYPREQWIVLYYSPAGTTHGLNTKALVFHYGEDKIKNGELPCTGPITVSGRATAEANLNGTPLLLTGNENDKHIYVEDQGLAIPATATVADAAGTPQIVLNCPLVRTRRGFAATPARLSREEKVYLLHTKAGTSFTAVGDTVAGSTNVTGLGTFGSVVKGMRVKAVGIKPGTLATAATANAVTLSQAALATGTGVTLTFDNGTISITVRGANIDEDVYDLDTSYPSTLVGDLLVVHNDNAKQALEYQFEKVLMPDASHADLGVLFKLHSMTALVNDLGLEQNRAS